MIDASNPFVLGTGLVLLALFVAAAVRWPSTVFLVSLAVVPVWAAPRAPGIGALYVGTAVSAIGIVSLTLRPRAAARTKVGGASAVLLSLVAIFLGMSLVLNYSFAGIAMITTPVAYWALPFALGTMRRREAESDLNIWATIRWAGLILGAAAVFERLTNTALGSLIPILNSGAASLANYQYREGLRAEVTWGHGIALAGVLAASAYLWIARAGFRYGRWASTVVIGLGTYATGSRAALVAYAMALVLALLWWVSSSWAAKFYLPAVLVAALVITQTALSGPDQPIAADYAASNLYRFALIEDAVNLAALIGPASDFAFTPGGYWFHGYRYLDNTLIQTLVSVGWIPTLALTAAYVTILVHALMLRGTVWVVLALQLPTLMSAGFFTQHQSFFWYLIGLACVAPSIKHQSESADMSAGLATSTALEARRSAPGRGVERRTKESVGV